MTHLFSYKNPKPEKTCAVVRYGGFGDAIQTSSIFPWLKEQGYHITLYTVPHGHIVVKNDPHLDNIIVQEIDAIPNADLGEFWEYTGKKYTKLVNLSESVEKSLLAMPWSIVHKWPHSMRNKYLNVNYLQFIHDIAEVPFPPRPKFYPTEDEYQWSLDEYSKMHGGKTILWILSGSAIHKTWGYLDEAIHRILSKNDGTNIVLIGDVTCKKLEAGWENVPKVYCRSGVWTIRETLAFAQVADLVIGPETGVLNAIAFDDVPKIVMMSHSSVENLTRDWKKCISLEPVKTPCYPCHQVHFNWDRCKQYEDTGIALCQANISVDRVLEAVGSVLDR